MSLSAVMMAARPPPDTAIAMKIILRSTTKRLAAVLAHCRGISANRPHPEKFEHRRRRHVPLPADPLRIPAYLRRRRLLLRLQPQFDAQALNPQREGLR
jgi:hypothetical protein